MDILLSDGDLYINENGDMELTGSVRQEIEIRLKWVLDEWRWDRSLGLPYFTDLFVKNPDVEGFRQSIREAVLGVEGVSSVSGIRIEHDSVIRKAVIRFTAHTEAGSEEVEAAYG